jgi:Mg-chelatase subunit ChlD
VGLQRFQLIVLPVAVAALLGALAAAALTVPDAAASPGRSTSGAPGAGGPCTITHTRQVAPVELPVGSLLTLTTTLRLVCQSDYQPLHVVLLVDSSEQMVEGGRNWLGPLLGSLESAVRAVDLRQTPWVQMGVVSFRDRVAVTEAFLTNDTEVVAAALHNMSMRNGLICPECGFREGLRKARRMLQSGSAGGPARQVVLVASRGFDPVVCDAVRASANEGEPFGTLMVTACGGGGCDVRCLSEAASAPQFAYYGGDWSYLAETMGDMVNLTGSFRPVLRLGLQDHLGELFSYAGGGDPEVATDGTLQWTFLPLQGPITRTVQAKAQREGTAPVSARAEAWLRYAAWARTGVVTQTYSLDRPLVMVLPAVSTPSTATPTATGVATHTATASVTPSATASLTSVATLPTASATQSPPRPGWRLLLPVAHTGRCPAEAMPLDAVLLIDVSGSMAVDDVPPFDSRWAAAGALAEELVRYHLTAQDRVAVVPFAMQAEVRAGLDAGRPAVMAALAHMPQWDGSRLDLALETARQELARGQSGGRRGTPVIVLFTDGDLNQAEADAVLRTSAEVRAWGARIVAVGLGGSVDRTLLWQLTGARARVWVTDPDSSPLALADLLGRVLHCPR